MSLLSVKSTSHRLKLFIGVAIIGLILINYQNCSRVAFEESNGSNNSVLVDGKTVTEQQTVNSADKYQQTDILFVVDDSCSMDKILENINKGIASVNRVSFPDSTLMAVTYTSPAYVNADGSVAFDKAFIRLSDFPDTDVIGKTPGFMNLVNAQNVQSYKNFIVGLSEIKDTLKQQVCSNSWFAPDDLSTGGGSSCFTAAMQSPLLCTGSEAGLVSLKQLLQKYQKNGNSLFRKNSLAQIIFVSDTHDPGSNYYGRTGAYPNQPNYEEIRDLIYAVQPNIQGVRFSGIVPLPRVADPLLNGLNVVGRVLGPSDTTLITEGTYGYSYLDLIKKTGGFAMHVEQPDWSGAMNSLVEQSALNQELILDLAYPIQEMLSVTVNGVDIDSNKIEKINDQKIVVRLDKSTSGQSYSVKVVYNRK